MAYYTAVEWPYILIYACMAPRRVQTPLYCRLCRIYFAWLCLRNGVTRIQCGTTAETTAKQTANKLKQQNTTQYNTIKITQ